MFGECWNQDAELLAVWGYFQVEDDSSEHFLDLRGSVPRKVRLGSGHSCSKKSVMTRAVKVIWRDRWT
jgi:hypothetical protein